MMTDSENIERGLFVALEHPEALTEPEELLKAYFNSTNIGLCLYDSGFRYLAINRTLAAIHGLPVEAHLGKTVREVLGDLGDLLEPKFQQAIETKTPIHFEISGMLPSQTEKGHWIAHYSSSPGDWRQSDPRRGGCPGGHRAKEDGGIPCKR